MTVSSFCELHSFFCWFFFFLILYCFNGLLDEVGEEQETEEEKPVNSSAFFLLGDVMLIYEPAGRSIQRAEESKKGAGDGGGENFIGASAAAESVMIER